MRFNELLGRVGTIAKILSILFNEILKTEKVEEVTQKINEPFYSL